MTGKDVTRLAAVSITDKSNTILYQAKDNPVNENVLEFLKVLASLINNGPELIKLIESNFKVITNTTKKETSDTKQEMLAIFCSALLEISIPLTNIIKCIQQEMIFPGFMKFRDAFYEFLPFKDIRGSYTVSIQVNDENVKIIHSKREQSHDSSPQSYYEFSWILIIVLDRKNYQITDIEHKIIDYSFHDDTSKDVMNLVRKYLKPFISNYTSVLRSTRSLSVYQAPVNFVLFSPQEIVNLAIDSLYRLPPNFIVHADHSKLPNTVSIIDLLKCLQKNSKSKRFEFKITSSRNSSFSWYRSSYVFNIS